LNANTGPLQSRVAVVTGATGGIGVAICRSLAQAGCQVVAVYRGKESDAQALIGSLPGNGHAAMQADVTTSASLDRLAAQLTEQYGTVDVLVNSAGTTRFVPHAELAALDDALIDQVFATNWRGPFATIRALKTLLEQRGGGVVINISSIAARLGIGSNVAYCASKAALDTMTVSLARALAPAIRVRTVSPGLVDTQFIKGMDPAWREAQIARTPLGRVAQPEEVGQAVVAAATLTASTGTAIIVDGGRLLG
jgi:3-oxoacyl-[acyl-carrier protein] reductase